MRLRPRHLRARLTLWYVSVLAALLIFAWVGTCALLFFQMRNQIDSFSIQEIETVEGLFFFAPDGRLQLREDYHNHPQSKEVIDRFLEVLSPGGAVLLRNAKLRGQSLGGGPFRGEGVGAAVRCSSNEPMSPTSSC